MNLCGCILPSLNPNACTTCVNNRSGMNTFITGPTIQDLDKRIKELETLNAQKSS